jgi:hypothetical protein
MIAFDTMTNDELLAHCSPGWDGVCVRCGHLFLTCRGNCTCLSCNAQRQDLERAHNGWGGTKPRERSS